MQEVIASFTAVMTWVILLMAGAAIVLLGLEAWRLPEHRHRALAGVLLMTVVLAATAAGLLLLALHHSQHSPTLSQLLLPLLACLLMLSISRLSFPPDGSSPAFGLSRLRKLLLIVLTGGALLLAGGLVVLDFVLP